MQSPFESLWTSPSVTQRATHTITAGPSPRPTNAASDKKTVNEAEKNQQVAISLPKVTVGRQIKEGDILYSAIPEEDFRKLREFKKYLSPEEIVIIKEIAEIMKKKNPVWGI